MAPNDSTASNLSSRSTPAAPNNAQLLAMIEQLQEQLLTERRTNQQTIKPPKPDSLNRIVHSDLDVEMKVIVLS